jgi:hypothetical protein
MVLAVVSVIVEKVATPFETVTVEVPPSAPDPLVIDAVTAVVLLLVMVFPFASFKVAVKVVIGVELLAV